ncbi:outer membrane protein assembly factor BamD [Phyllobacterium sp. 21LDTY02-6]|uniref:outer membrane protein assembly factor BamD n=1 Tax=unclassified Phyllobacterium TaxID=2638441 RepID=UPI0020204978|nr:MULTISPECIES: outer membrane protein assembly factor BamD [unclassified Phyllobacterium]MCO4315984.1 outer membrane protein assembly factor BamD [Phyllobacterium sp. 21LDTY02-6]MCX8279592.1 outer membrane protein assembly factor BamD [Phyllobacterium sp. 0TCS1.6C]MCX8292217.1 outer membrane protein assembly factor BamD [Phyllobacterium sp. 0TCS1.6A]
MNAGFGGKARLALLLFPIAGAVALSGCASKDEDLDLAAYVDTIEPADVLYNQALANLNAGRLDEAAKKFDAVDRQHPYSEFARKSLVMGAFANYRAGKYDEAVAMTKRYVSLYPTQPEAAYAYYITGLSYYRQIPDVTREQTMTRRSIAAFNEVVERYPDSEYVEDSKAKIRFGRDQLAGKEMQIGRYYLERKEYIAAIKRFRGVVEQYSNTRHVEEALARLTEAYYALGLTSEAQTAAAVLGQNYPDSQWYKDSYKLLQGGGLEPRENSGSWLSKAASAITGGKDGA